MKAPMAANIAPFKRGLAFGLICSVNIMATGAKEKW